MSGEIKIFKDKIAEMGRDLNMFADESIDVNNMSINELKSFVDNSADFRLSLDWDTKVMWERHKGVADFIVDKFSMLLCEFTEREILILKAYSET